MIISSIICTTILIVFVSVLVYKYKNPYTEEIVSSSNKTRKSEYSDGSKSVTDYTLMIIKRTYRNGKSILITKHL